VLAGSPGSSEGHPALLEPERLTELFLFRCQGATAAYAVVPLENSIASTSIFCSPSYKEPTVDALAPEAEEGRGWLRKATGSCLPSFDPWMSEWGNPAPVMGCHSDLNT
jgi:hypothetical protein